MWHWGPLGSGETLFVTEDGTIIKGQLKDYTHVEDELGRACGGIPKKGDHVDMSLKKYLVGPEEMAILKEKKLREWEAKVLGEMEEGDEVSCPFADGSQPWVFEKWFLERRGAIPLHKSYDRISAKHREEAFPGSRDSLFFHQGKFWVHLGHLSKLAVTQTDHLKQVATFIESQ